MAKPSHYTFKVKVTMNKSTQTLQIRGTGKQKDLLIGTLDITAPGQTLLFSGDVKTAFTQVMNQATAIVLSS